MKILISLLAVALSAGVAHAQGAARDGPPTTIVCLDPSGRSLPPVCRVPGSRIDQREFICQCFEGMQTPAAICPQGVRPPPEGLALNRARREAARSGTLVGATFRGKPICVAPGR